MRTISIALAAVLIAAATCDAQQAPRIVEALPKFWETGVSAGLKTISITFDQSLRPGFSSWLGPSSVLPESDVHSANGADGLSSKLSVRLQPGKVYVFALNERASAGVGFQTKRGIPLSSHYLVFQTAGAAAPEDTPPRVVSTIPATGSQVDPAKIRSFTATFDRTMNSKTHGLQLAENGKAVDIAAARFQYSPDGRSFVVAYEFKPSARYEVTLNSTENIGFTSATRIPLWPVRLTFTTGQPQ